MGEPVKNLAPVSGQQMEYFSISLSKREATDLRLTIRRYFKNVDTDAALLTFIANKFADDGWRILNIDNGSKPAADFSLSGFAAWSITSRVSVTFERERTGQPTVSNWKKALGVRQGFLGGFTLTKDFQRSKGMIETRLESFFDTMGWTFSVAFAVMAVISGGGTLGFTMTGLAALILFPPLCRLLGNRITKKVKVTISTFAFLAFVGNRSLQETPAPVTVPSHQPANVARSTEMPLAQTSNKKRLGNPVSVNLGKIPRAKGDDWVATTTIDIINKNPNTPVVTLKYSYPDSTPGHLTTEEWLFDIDGDYIQLDLIDFQSGKKIGHQRQILKGSILQRLKAAKQNADRGFKLNDGERWITSDPTNGAITIERFQQKLERDRLGEIVVNVTLGTASNEAIVIVGNAWNSLPHETRLNKAKAIQKAWWGTLFPIQIDKAFVRLVNQNGVRVGGSGVMGASVSVSK